MQPFDDAVDAMMAIGTHFGLFDRRVQLPLDQIVSSVLAETGEDVSVDDLQEMSDSDLIPFSDEGMPLYAPSRVGLLIELERKGYNIEELRDFAESEEATIDQILTTEELEYIDDDLDLLVNACSWMVKHGSLVPEAEQSPQQISQLKNAKNNLAKLRHYKTMGIPEILTKKIADAAFKQRASNELIRVMLLDQDRARIRAGYSPNICASASRYEAKEGISGMFEATVERIHWEWTIKGALASEEEVNAPGIRVPSFLLEGDRVTPTNTLAPREYQAKWDQHDLDGYLLAWSEINGERRCLNCLSVLGAGGSPARRYCGERCRNAAKQRRFRKSNPVANYENQRKYWTSLDD